MQYLLLEAEFGPEQACLWQFVSLQPARSSLERRGGSENPGTGGLHSDGQLCGTAAQENSNCSTPEVHTSQALVIQCSEFLDKVFHIN